MARKRRRGSSGRAEDTGRRGFLLKLAGGGAIVIGGTTSLVSSGSFSLVAADRNSTVGVASQGNGIVGLSPGGTVKKNSQDPLTDVSNNGSQAITVVVTLTNCGDGGLYDNDDESDVCSVTFTLNPGETRTIDIVAAVTGTIPYSISVSSPSGFSLETTASVQAEAGNVDGAVRIQAPNKNQDFTARPPQGNGGNVFEVKSVDVRDDDTPPENLDRVIFTIREAASNTVVGSFTEENPPADRYSPSGNPAVTIQPNSGYTIQSGTQYSLTVRGEDTDGNFATETVEDTA